MSASATYRAAITILSSSINDVTRFRDKIDSPSPVCHILSQISEPPSKMTSHAYEPPPQSSDYCLHRPI